MVGVFLSCYLLETFDSVFCSLARVCTWQSETLATVITFLQLLNCAVNPVAYALFKREIRKELKRLFVQKTALAVSSFVGDYVNKSCQRSISTNQGGKIVFSL